MNFYDEDEEAKPRSREEYQALLAQANNQGQSSLGNMQQTQAQSSNPIAQTSLQSEPGFGEKLEGLAKIAANGVMLNQMDEASGVMGGIANMGANLFRENKLPYAEAFKQGYQIARDDWRNSEQIARDAWSQTSAAVDTTAQMAAPMNFLNVGKAAPLVAKASTRALNNVIGGAANGIGETEGNNPYEYAKNIGINAASNFLGNCAANKAMGRGGDDFTRSVISSIEGQSYNTIENLVANKLENNNPFSSSTDDDDEWWKKLLGL